MRRNPSARLEALEALEAENAAVPELDAANGDALDDDETLVEAWYGLRKTSTTASAMSWWGGTLHSMSDFTASGRYWGRIAARTMHLCRASSLVLLPLDSAECRAAVAALNAGALWMRPLAPNCWKSHHWTVCIPYESNDLRRLQEMLAHALDKVSYQTDGMIIETADALRTLLMEGMHVTREAA